MKKKQMTKVCDFLQTFRKKQISITLLAKKKKLKKHIIKKKFITNYSLIDLFVFPHISTLDYLQSLSSIILWKFFKVSNFLTYLETNLNFHFSVNNIFSVLSLSFHHFFLTLLSILSVCCNLSYAFRRKHFFFSNSVLGFLLLKGIHINSS